jgi:hypothetical protein
MEPPNESITRIIKADVALQASRCDGLDDGKLVLGPVGNFF